MNNNQKNENPFNRPKFTFVNFESYFWSKDRSKLFLVLSGNIVVSVHANFLRARMGLPYTSVASEVTDQAPTS